MRELNEQEILEWIRTQGNRSFKYRINAQALGVLSLLGAGLLGVALLAWVAGYFDRDMVFAGIIVLVTLNLFIWTRIVMSMWFVSRHVVGLSDTELLLVRGYKATLIPLALIRSSSLGWNEDDRGGLLTSLPLNVDGRSFNIRLVTLYYSLEQFPLFLGGLLEHVSDNALQPKDNV